MPLSLVIDDKSGFCFGVINAIRTAEEYLKNHSSLYCLGDIVHNNDEVERLTQMGLIIISHNEFASLKNTTVLIRAHGEPPSVYQIAESNNITLIDATCPVVLRLQKRIYEEYQKFGNNKQIIIFGKKGHAEVVGLLGQTDNNGVVVSSTQDLDLINYQKPSKIYSQTTQNLDQYFQVIAEISARYKDNGLSEYFEYEDTICRKVSMRAQQIAEFAVNFDMILFVTGEKSSNGLYLSDICKRHNPNTKIITSTEQVDELDFNDVKSIGICGATSTPMWLMQKIADRICTKNEKNF